MRNCSLANPLQLSKSFDDIQFAVNSYYWPEYWYEEGRNLTVEVAGY